MRRVRAGFTLLEVMVALAFIAVALVAILEAEGGGIRLTDQARQTIRTVFLARQVLAASQAQASFSTGTEKGLFEEPLNDLAWERETSSHPWAPGLYKIVVRVHPVDRPASEGVSLEGFAYRETSQ